MKVSMQMDERELKLAIGARALESFKEAAGVNEKERAVVLQSCTLHYEKGDRPGTVDTYYADVTLVVGPLDDD